MVGIVKPTAGLPGDDRLARASAMVNDAVALLLAAMDEIKGEEGHGDDRTGESGGNDHKPGGGSPNPR